MLNGNAGLFWPIVGIDPLPGRVAHPFRVLLTVLTLPFHAFLGVTIMGQSALIGGDQLGSQSRRKASAPKSASHSLI